MPGIRRQERKAALKKARAEIETRAHARYALERAEYEKKMAARRCTPSISAQTWPPQGKLPFGGVRRPNCERN